jgi:hypothetical protein
MSIFSGAVCGFKSANVLTAMGLLCSKGFLMASCHPSHRKLDLPNCGGCGDEMVFVCPRF